MVTVPKAGLHQVTLTITNVKPAPPNLRLRLQHTKRGSGAGQVSSSAGVGTLNAAADSKLARELSNAMVGCSVDGKFVNNISYADDMVLLSPSISALRTLVSICERYAEAHGLRYNTSKSELLIFEAKGASLCDQVPPINLNGTPLKRVMEFKYLGHCVNASLKDDVDLERERRALAVRSNMLIRRRFSHGTIELLRKLEAERRHLSHQERINAEQAVDAIFGEVEKILDPIVARAAA